MGQGTTFTVTLEIPLADKLVDEMLGSENLQTDQQNEDADLIFMDIQMPVMNGIEATQAIRKLADPWAASIPIIAMTADAFSENVTACLAAGMNGHIAKPIDMKLVLKEIRRIKEEEKFS